MTHPDLAAEQAHLDRSHDRLEELRAASQATLREALLSSAGGTPQTHVEREALVDHATRRLTQLDLHGESLCFGRIDTDAADAFHIGRVAVNDTDQTPLVVDWRAPVAEPFYRATGAHPLGLRRRRHFLTEGRKLLGIEDELFGWGDGPGDVADGTPGGSLGLPGSGVLLAALERSRSGRMRDIVATVQREQDEVIRAPLAGILVVQGGPGTGKTAVALHRAAYLLYTHRFPLERQGVVVVGPNRLFLRYIEQVLPSLGESGVELATIATLVAGHVGDVDASGAEPLAVARLKGDERMARVVAKAVHDRERPLPADVTFVHAGHSLRITVADSADLVAAGRRRGGVHNAARPLVERLLFGKLHARWVAAAERRRRHFGVADEEPGLSVAGGEYEPRSADEPPSVEDFAADIRRHPDVRAALERVWPRLTPAQLLHDLFGASALVDLAARRWLGEDERRLLHRRRHADVADVRWTLADLPLLDEAAARLGPLRAKRHDDGMARTFGHIVVDEAQDLSAMQLRVLARRSLSGSMTLVGDVAQATGPSAPDDWKDVLAHLPDKRPPTIAQLTVNYRTPVELMDYAGRVLAAAQPGARPPESVRSTGTPPTVVAVPSGNGTLAAAVADAVRSERAAVGDGLVAVIHPPSMGQDLARALASAGIESGDADHHALDMPVTLVPVDLVKGLEFDAAVVVEPAAVVEEAGQGLRALYVALTRATKRLAVVHERPLPPSLADRQ
ncbi:MAG: hypothetical protein JWO37_3281 [Acidimicrobiales bacterium]|nr:hypothetical protein [Acidimicrobiales bacterium]